MIDPTRSPVSLAFYNSPMHGGGFLQNVTAAMQRTWKRSVRDVGGFWIGSAEYDGTPAELLDVFQNGLEWEMRETAGSQITWQGIVAEMELTLKGQVYRRSWSEIANRVKTTYSTIGPNLITNNSCETAAWDAIGSPATREVSGAWATQGLKSCHVVTNAANEGVTIQTAIPIAAGKAYDARVTVSIISGTWRLQISRAGTVMDYNDQSSAGQTVMMSGISEDNQFAGNVTLALFCTSASGEIYADAAVFQLGPARGETSWYDDLASQAEWGVMEEILSKAGMTDAAANAAAQTELRQEAWGTVRAPASIQAASDVVKDKLTITCVGYAFTLANKYTQLNGEDAASTIVANLIGEAQFVEPGYIQVNSMLYSIENRDAYRDWDLLRDVTKAGDSTGNRWTCGVRAGRLFDYQAADMTRVARLRGGQMLDAGGGKLEGWMAAPGLVYIDDLPRGPGSPSGNAEDDPRAIWMGEVEWSLGNYLAGKPDITYRQEAL